MDGFFYKDEVKPKKERVVKQAIVHELPPVLKIQVPSEKKKEKKAKQFKLDRPQLELDIECYSNYFLVKFRQEDGTHHEYEQIDSLGVALDRKSIRKKLEDFEIVTFNGNHFDIPILNYALSHKDCKNADLKKICNDIIKNELPAYKIEKKYNLKPLIVEHYDLLPLCSSNTSLKMMGARLHSPVLRHLPYPEETRLTEKQMNVIAHYCGNDLEVTEMVNIEFAEDIALRRNLGSRYSVDLRSRSDAQCAEDIFRAEAERRTGKRVYKPSEIHTRKFYYQIPDFISFTDAKLNEVLDILRTDKFTAKPVNKGITGPERLDKLKIDIGGMTYTMGIGGLHSTEKSSFHLADDKLDLYDFDVTSYYPAIVLNCGLYPPAIGHVFLDIYKVIRDERIDAKRTGDIIKANGMKITILGTFGKFGSPWSILYAPDLMIQVTLTGQLAILMLIERLTRNGIQIVSGNTDGIVIKPRRDQEELMRTIIKRWERITGFDTEETHYAGLWSRDVNNYLAIGHDGKIKAKGIFGYAGRKKNPEHDVCTDALVEYFRDGVPVEETIRACRDIRKFISVRQVNGGAVKGNEHLGKVVRWYYSQTETGAIHYVSNGNKVPKSDGACPVAVLPEKFPDDVNYDWYINKCKKLFY